MGEVYRDIGVREQGGPYGVLPYTVGTSPPGTCISLVPVDTLYSHCTTSRMYPTLGTGIYWYRGPRGMQYQGVTTSTVTGVSPPYRPLPPTTPWDPPVSPRLRGHLLTTVSQCIQHDRVASRGSAPRSGPRGTRGHGGGWGYTEGVLGTGSSPLDTVRELG